MTHKNKISTKDSAYETNHKQDDRNSQRRIRTAHTSEDLTISMVAKIVQKVNRLAQNYRLYPK